MVKTTYKSNNNIVYSCKYHVVWSPKYRRKVLISFCSTVAGASLSVIKQYAVYRESENKVRRCKR